MLRNKPRFTYNGLTLVLSNPSRFDKVSLLSANGGQLANELLRPEFNTGQCDIRVKEDRTPLLPSTKCVLLLGQDAAQSWLQNTDNTIGEIRGSVFRVNDVPHISSFFPQDAVDIKDFETEHNPIHDGETVQEDRAVESDSLGEKRRHGRTSRSNFRFWLMKDIEKCKYILKHGIPPRPFEPEYIIYPQLNVVLEYLKGLKDDYLYVDLETDENWNILCIGLSSRHTNHIYVVPLFSYDYTLAYSACHKLLGALACAIADNTVVAHNGAGFDFIVLCHKYRIPLGPKLYDTMIAHHRCFPEAEKSLGHCTSLWTWEPFHKDEGGGGYSTNEQMLNLMRYCGKDVYTMRLIHDAIEAYSIKNPGIKESIEQAMSSIRPYLITSMQGIKYDETILQKTMDENDKLMMQYIRIINLLIGPQALTKLKARSKKSMPGSNMQCCMYFHDMLGYPVIMRGKEKKDGTRGASLGKKAMYMLRLKYDNPVIDFVMAYRELAKESGSLKFNPWNPPCEEQTIDTAHQNGVTKV